MSTPDLEPYKQLYPSSFIFTLFINFNSSGDSGGGFYVNEDGIYTVHGIVSYAISDDCSPNYPVVFVDVAKFILWIREVGEF